MICNMREWDVVVGTGETLTEKNVPYGFYVMETKNLTADYCWGKCRYWGNGPFRPTRNFDGWFLVEAWVDQTRDRSIRDSANNNLRVNDTIPPTAMQCTFSARILLPMMPSKASGDRSDPSARMSFLGGRRKQTPHQSVTIVDGGGKRRNVFKETGGSTKWNPKRTGKATPSEKKLRNNLGVPGWKHTWKMVIFVPPISKTSQSEISEGSPMCRWFWE